MQCVVAAPSKIPRGSGERVKTDRRDAELLARLLLAGKLHPVRVRGGGEEALRDLIRVGDVTIDRNRARLFAQGLQLDGVPGSQRHLKSLLGKQSRKRCAESLPGADDQGGLMFELCHPY